ncbi:MAG: Na+/H+ antiporter subunit E [Pseudomonadota bacterium]
MFLINILLAVAWGFVSGSFSLINLALGFALGSAGLWLIRGQVATEGYFTRTRRILSLFILFLKELVMSAWAVAVLVCSGDMKLAPGIFAYPLQVDRDFEITLLANMITLTPGTLSVDVSDDRSTLYIHALDASDPDEERRNIAEGFERKIMEAFR